MRSRRNPSCCERMVTSGGRDDCKGYHQMWRTVWTCGSCSAEPLALEAQSELSRLVASLVEAVGDLRSELRVCQKKLDRNYYLLTRRRSSPDRKQTGVLELPDGRTIFVQPRHRVHGDEVNNTEEGNDWDSDRAESNDSAENSLFNLVLRMRNSQRELNDIRFEYILGKDSAEAISAELVGAGLVDSRDMATVAANLRKLVDNQTSVTSVTFPLSSGVLGSEVPSDVAFIGYASMSIVD